MNFSQDTSEEPTFILSYDEDYLVINQSKFDCHCIIHRSGMILPWEPDSPLSLKADDFRTVLEHKPELVILGTGSQLRFPDNDLRRFFSQQGIGLEIMDTGAACRTYNILLTEGRDVGAAILLNRDFQA